MCFRRPSVAVTVVTAGSAVVLPAAWWAWRRLGRVAVVGTSMQPTLQPGDRLLIWKTTTVRPGDIVAVADPRQGSRTVVKRASTVKREGVFLLGDNTAHSTDSRDYGPVPIGSVQGTAVYRYAPPARAGRL